MTRSADSEDNRRTEVWPGKAYPLGATYDGVGTNFALFSEAAERVELCLFDDDGTETRVVLPRSSPSALSTAVTNSDAPLASRLKNFWARQ